jgi:hypothetical protein
MVVRYQVRRNSMAIHIELTDTEAETVRDICTAVRLNWKIKQSAELNALLLAIREKTHAQIRLEYLRGELRAGTMSYGEQAELEGLKDHIQPGDVELAEAAGIPEEEFNA